MTCRPRDYYHTCYSLSGMSLAQHGYNPDAEPMVVGPKDLNLLVKVDPLHNVSCEKSDRAKAHFGRLGRLSKLSEGNDE